MPSAIARWLVPLLALSLARPVAAAQAQPPAATPDTIPVSLDDAVARAVGGSNEVRLARAQVQLAEAQVRSARAAALPRLDGAVNYVRTFETQFSTDGLALPDSLRFRPDSTASLDRRVGYLERNAPSAGLGGLSSLFGALPFGQPNAWTFSLSGSQPLYSGGRVTAAQRLAARFREQAALELDERLGEIELQVRTAYYQALLARELEVIAAVAIEQADAFLAQERLRRETGLSADLDVLRAEVAAENLRPRLVQARNQAAIALLELKRLVGLPLHRPIQLASPLELPDARRLAQPEVEAPRLLARRAAVRAAEQRVAMGEQQVRLARAGYLPSVDLSANYSRIAFPPDVFRLTGQSWRTDFTATVAMRVPLFDGFRTRGDVQQALATLEGERLRLAQLRDRVELEYEQALGERRRAAAEIAARQRTVEQATRVHDLTVLRYRQGLATQLEVSDARLGALQARTNLAQAISDFHLADATAARALGLPQRLTTTLP